MNLEKYFPTIPHELRRIQRDSINNSQSTAWQAAIDVTRIIAHCAEIMFSTYTQNRQTMAATEARRSRDELQSRVLARFMSSMIPTVQNPHYHSGYLRERMWETDSDSD